MSADAIWPSSPLLPSPLMFLDGLDLIQLLFSDSDPTGIFRNLYFYTIVTQLSNSVEHELYTFK